MNGIKAEKLINRSWWEKGVNCGTGNKLVTVF